MINGIINVYKEKGFTSHDVVAKLRGIAGQKKIGHTGTLDPDAVGVLPVCFGNATKLCSLLTDKSKEYITRMQLGIRTDTQDISGKILSEEEVTVNEEEIRSIILSFVGDYDQIPPMYSALKVNGKKLYELAREGKEVERAPRRVHIAEIDILKCDIPFIEMKVACSKGTYIRTLCDDIGNRLGCGGTMVSLMRTRVGNYRIEDALTLSALQKLKDEKRLEEAVGRVEDVFGHMPAVCVKEEFQKLLDNGNSLHRVQTAGEHQVNNGVQVRMYGFQGRFYGIFEYDGELENFKPVKMFLEREE